MSVSSTAADALVEWLQESGLSQHEFNRRIEAVTTVHTLKDGRLFIPSCQVIEWPRKMREWIKTDRYWKPDMLRDGYVSPCL